MAKKIHPITMRLDEGSVLALEAVRERLASQTPGWSPTRTDVFRHLIASSASAAVSPGTKLPHPEKPMRSR